jgi:hypothetical protein
MILVFLAPYNKAPVPPDKVRRIVVKDALAAIRPTAANRCTNDTESTSPQGAPWAAMVRCGHLLQAALWAAIEWVRLIIS